MLLLLAPIQSHALDTATLVQDEAVLAILNRKCIALGTSELVAIHFKTACSVLEKNDLATSVQEEFVRSISQTGAVDFPVLEDGPGQYLSLIHISEPTRPSKSSPMQSSACK